MKTPAALRGSVICLLFLLAPGFLIWSHGRLQDEHGPYWLWSNFDPSYAYLFNSLLVANGEAPFHIDHPGCPLQIIGAAYIRVSNLGCSAAEMNRRVLSAPEDYLLGLNTILLYTIAATILVAGFMIWRATGQWLAGFVAQLSSVVFLQVHRALVNVTPEPLLVAFGILIGGVFCAKYFKLEDKDSENAFTWHLWCLSIASGLAVATKITFAPLCLLPFLLIRRLKYVSACLVIMAISFIVGISPALTELGRMMEWFSKLATHTGHYGGGEEGFINPETYVGSVKALLANTQLLPRCWIFVVIVLAFGWYMQARHGRNLRRWVVLAAVLVLQVLGLLLIAKHPNAHYLLPVYVCTAFLIPLTYVYALSLEASWTRIIVKVGAVLVLSLGFYELSRSWPLIKRELVTNRISAEKGIATLDKCSKTAQVVYYYRASAPVFALNFGNNFSRRYFASVLDAAYKDVLFFNIFNARFETFSDTLEPASIFAKHRTLVFAGSGGIDRMPFRQVFPIPVGGTKELLSSDGLNTLHLIRSP